MAQYIIALTDILERELRHYEQICLLLKRKQKHLIDSDTEGIKRATIELEDSIAKIKNLEKERSKLLDEFVTSTLTRPASDAISWKKTFPDEQASEELLIAVFRSHERVKGRLKQVLNEVAELQQTNQLLIMQGRDVLEACMHCLLTQVHSETYDSTGTTRKSIDSERNLVDRRI